MPRAAAWPVKSATRGPSVCRNHHSAIFCLMFGLLSPDHASPSSSRSSSPLPWGDPGDGERYRAGGEVGTDSVSARDHRTCAHQDPSDGFEFPTRHPDRLFFPTLHIHDGAVKPFARFAHTLYAQGKDPGS